MFRYRAVEIITQKTVVRTPKPEGALCPGQRLVGQGARGPGACVVIAWQPAHSGAQRFFSPVTSASIKRAF